MVYTVDGSITVQKGAGQSRAGLGRAGLGGAGRGRAEQGGAQGTGHRAQGTGHRAQGRGHRAQGTRHRAQGTGHRAQWHRAHGTGHKARHLEILNTEQVEDHGVGQAELAFQLGGFACHHLAYITFIRHLPHTHTACQESALTCTHITAVPAQQNLDSNPICTL